MTGNALITNATAAAARAVRTRAVRVEKACNTSNFGHETLRGNHEARAHDPRLAQRGLSRSETDECAPLWYGPRLRPAFVAQVLGQVLTPDGAHDARSVFAAYEDVAARGTARPILDRCV